jgi:hypothetical protein
VSDLVVPFLCKLVVQILSGSWHQQLNIDSLDKFSSMFVHNEPVLCFPFYVFQHRRNGRVGDFQLLCMVENSSEFGCQSILDRFKNYGPVDTNVDINERKSTRMASFCL